MLILLAVIDIIDELISRYINQMLKKSSKKTLENKYLDAKNNKLLVKWYGIALSVDQIQGNFSARNMILKEAFGIEI